MEESPGGTDHLDEAAARAPSAEPRNPAAIELLQTLKMRWQDRESYRDISAQALDEARATVTELAVHLEGCVGTLRVEYLKKIRTTTHFLFTVWMPIGYASMLCVSEPDALCPTTRAMMHYGAAVTILDDVADTDLFDDIWGSGVSDMIAKYIAENGLPASGLPPLPEKASWVVKFAHQQIQSFREIVQTLRGSAEFGDSIERVIRTFLETVQICRSGRRSLKAGQATPTELQAMADAVPHGMTIVMVALVSHAQRGTSARSIKDILVMGEMAQRICHYQNALATLDREIDACDPSNPIILDAMKCGNLDQRDFMERSLKKERILEAVEPSRLGVETRLNEMERRFDERAARDERGYLRRFAFGVRNLHLLYNISLGKV